MGKSTINHHFQWLFVCLPEGTWWHGWSPIEASPNARQPSAGAASCRKRCCRSASRAHKTWGMAWVPRVPGPLYLVFCWYPLVMTNIAIENCHLLWIYPLKMVIVKLPEGIWYLLAYLPNAHTKVKLSNSLPTTCSYVCIYIIPYIPLINHLLYLMPVYYLYTIYMLYISTIYALST